MNCDQDQIARALKYKNSTNGAFKGLKAAASYFGMVSYPNEHYLSVSQPWIDAFHDEDSERLKELRREAMTRPELYKQLFEDFKDRQISSEKLTRQLYLNPKYGILKDAADTAARAFLESAGYAGILDSNNYLRVESSVAPSSGATEGSDIAGKSDRTDSAPGEDLGRVGGSKERETRRDALPQDIPDDLDRIEVRLLNGRRAYLFLPVPLAARDKDRLKKHIDLVLDEDEAAESRTPLTGDETGTGA